MNNEGCFLLQVLDTMLQIGLNSTAHLIWEFVK